MDNNKNVTPGELYGAAVKHPTGKQAPYLVAWLEQGPVQGQGDDAARPWRLGYIYYDGEPDKNGIYIEQDWGYTEPGPKAPDMSVQELLEQALGQDNITDGEQLLPLPESMTPYSLRRDHTVYKLDDGDEVSYLIYGWSDNPAMTEGCDACLWYYLFEEDMATEVDGGEMDYDSDGKGYITLADALPDILEFACADGEGILEDDTVTKTELTGLCQEDFGL